jgi:adenine specific DNA methylase Mod
MTPRKNRLYFGDNLDWLRNPQEFPDESVDVIYLDPPFNSKANYNVLFEEKDGTKSRAQITAFKDTWHWGIEAETAFRDTVMQGGKLAQVMTGLREFLGQNDMMAYLSMMAPRLAEMKRVLKSTGSIFVHCDPTASHYLKQILDAIFSPRRFLNEIVWKRSSAHSDTKQGMKRCGKIHDVIFCYGKGLNKNRKFNPIYTPYTEEYLKSEYRHKEGDRRFKQTDLTAAKPGGDVEYDWHVKKPIGKRSRWQADLKDDQASEGRMGLQGA